MNNGLLLDALVLGAYLITIVGIGLYVGRKEEGMHDFALGGRSIPWWAVLASILAAEISAGTFLGTPGEGHALHNFTYVQLAIGTVVARVIVASVFIKPFYDLRVVSIYEFLEMRFGLLTKRVSSAVFLLTRMLASGSRIFVAAILLALAYELFTGVHPTDHQTLLIYAGAVVFITLITAIYTTFGGIKAVVWTDLIQVCVMFGSMGFVLWTLWNATGGWATLEKMKTSPADLTFWDWGLTVEGNPNATVWERVKNMFQTEYTVFSAFIASVFVTMATHGTDQDMVQRMLTAKDHKRGRLALMLSGLADIPVVFCFTLIGVLLWAYYQIHNPAMERKGAEVFAWYILNELPPGIRGLMAAGLFSTAMGSLSTALNALATSFTKDWYVGLWHPQANDHEQLRAVRWSTAMFSALLAGIGIATAWIKITHPELRIIPIVLGSFGYTYGPLLGVFLVGMLTRGRGNDFGNALGMMCGFLAVAVLSGLPNDIAHNFGFQFYKQPTWMPVIEFPWRIMFGTVVTVAVAMLFSTPAEKVHALRERIKAAV